MITAEGLLLLPQTATCQGWQLLLDPAGRPVFLAYCQKGPVVNRDTGSAYWDAELQLPRLRARARARAVHSGDVYIETRFDFLDDGSSLSGMLKWEAVTGHWRVLGEDAPLPRT